LNAPGRTWNARAEGFVLAGGRSSRMGRDKALVALLGLPMIEHSVTVLRAAGLRTRIAGGTLALEEFAEVVRESCGRLGPLGGVCAALAACQKERAVFLPVDMPLMAPRMVKVLLEAAEDADAAIALAALDGKAQSFPAVVRRDALTALRGELEAGRRACLRAFQAAAGALGQTPLLVAAEPVANDPRMVEAWFTNLNTEEDVRRAEALPDARPLGLKG